MSELKKKLFVARDQDGFHRKAAELFLESYAFTLKGKKKFTVALTGGSTPKHFYSLLAEPYFKSRINWSQVFVFWGDERFVPPSDDQSNYKMAKDTLLSKIPLPEKNIFRIKGEMGNAQEAAKAYNQALHAFFNLDYSIPEFDLIYLGVGEDGHTASLFPHTEALKEKTHWVTSNYVEKLNSHRITLTFPIINNAHRVILLCNGENKSRIVKELFRDDIPIDRYPVQLVNPVRGELIWLYDKAAVSKLPMDVKSTIFHL